MEVRNDPRSPDEGRIVALAAAQQNVIRLDQLVALGLSARAVRGRVASGRYRRLHRGVYAIAAVGIWGRELAAVFACGPGAVLSHRSAAGLWGIRARHHGPVEVTVPNHRRRRPGIQPHASVALRPQDVTTRHGIPVTTPERTLTDCADLLIPSAQEQALATAERLGLVDRARLSTPPGRRHVGPQRPRYTRSAFERDVLRAIERWGLPLPETNQVVAGWEVDLLWREQRFVVELDQYETHADRGAFERDRRKQGDLDDAGYRVRRVTDTRFRQRPDEVRAVLARALL